MTLTFDITFRNVIKGEAEHRLTVSRNMTLTLTFDITFRNIIQGEAEHRKYKRLKLGGGQAHDR
jgi:hypothetical protein